MNTPFNNDDPMMKSQSNFEMDKLISWKNEPLVQDEYFYKLRICILQRIQMDQEFDGIKAVNDILQIRKKRLKRFWIYTSGIAAVLVIAYSCFQIFPNKIDLPLAQQGTRKTAIANKTLQIDSTNSETSKKIDVSPIEPYQSDSVPNRQQFEIAMESITDEDLEAINWELYLNETF